MDEKIHVIAQGAPPALAPLAERLRAAGIEAGIVQPPGANANA